MKITRANYEAYFLDYLEGNLDDTFVDDFIEFLQENPDLKEELQLFSSVSLEPEIARYEKKDKLIKEKFDLKEEFEKAAVGILEGDISLREKAAFEAYLRTHPEKQKEFELFQQTQLKPDIHILFPNKTRLYHFSGGKTILLWAARVAAILVVAFLTYWFAGKVVFNRIKTDSQPVYTENKKENPEPKSLPDKVEKKQEPISVKEQQTAPVKKQESGTQLHKITRESNSGRIDHEKVAFTRTAADVPDKMPVKYASLRNDEAVVASLAEIKPKRPELPPVNGEERLLADLVKEKTGLDNLSLEKAAKAGLKLVSGFSREKFSFETDDDGQIVELNFDSRLLAFSIPTNKN